MHTTPFDPRPAFHASHRASRLPTACAAAALALLASCSGGGGNDGGEQAVHVSPALVQVVTLAGTAFDAAIAQDWVALPLATAHLDSSWQAYVPVAMSDGANPRDIAHVDDAIASLWAAVWAASPDALAAAHAANDVCAPMSHLYALYGPTAPPDIVALHYLDCELVLDGIQVDFGRALDQMQVLSVTWLGVRDAILGAHGGQSVAHYESALAAMNAAILAADGPALEAAATDGDDVVDGMDDLFDDDVQKGPQDGPDGRGDGGPEDGGPEDGD